MTRRAFLPYALCLALVAGCGGSAPKAPAGQVTPSASAAVAGTALAWTPDGSLVTADRAGDGPSTYEPCPSPQPRFEVRLHAPGDRAGRVVAADPAVWEPVAGRVSPGGAYLAVLGFCDEEFVGSVNVIPLRGAGKVRTLPLTADTAYGNPFAPRSLAWLSATELLVLRTTYGEDDKARGEAVVVDVTTLRERVALAGDDLHAVRPMPGGRLLAISGKGYEFRVEVVEPGGERRSLGTAGAAEPSPDGSRVAMWDVEPPTGGGAYDARLRIVPLDGGKAAYAELRGDFLAASWSPASDRLVVGAEEFTETTPSPGAEDDVEPAIKDRLFLVTAAGAARELALPGYEGTAVWSPDGKRLAYYDGKGATLVVGV